MIVWYLQLIVQLNDVNDNTPQFGSLPQNITVSESAAMSSTVFTVSATDADATSTITYSITSDG